MLATKALTRPFGAGANLTPIQRVWMLSYELAGIAHAGGLGEAVSGLARSLSQDYGLKVTVLLPSHGKHLDPVVRDAYNLREISTFIASGSRRGTNGIRYGFLSGAEDGSIDDVDIVLIKGLDDPTAKWLDSPVLYDHNVTFEKMALFSQALRLYAEYLVSTGNRSQLPDLVHAHDWHMVPSGIALKQQLRANHFDVPLLFTVHLLSHVTLPWHYGSEEWCGVRDLPVDAPPVPRKGALTCRQIWQDHCHDSLEQFGCYVADFVTSVSESYLSNEIMTYVRGIIRGKSGYIYNGCDWNFDEMRSQVLKEHGLQRTMKIQQPFNDRQKVRRLLLTRDIALDESESDPGDEPRGLADGPLVLMTGRLSPQKGVDLLLEAVPRVKNAVPNARFLLFLLQSGDPDLSGSVRNKVDSNRENIRVIYGKHPSLYSTAHLAADVYAMPSRTEPFGISALEAMLTGNPVVGTNTGGIKETVLDIAIHRERGTGLLVPPEDVESLADSLISFLLVASADAKSSQDERGAAEIAKKIPIRFLRKIVEQDLSFGSRLRNNCRSRVEQDFRWKNAGQMAIERYGQAAMLASRLT